jgi:uncharacterized membrane protein YGL010W
LIIPVLTFWTVLHLAIGAAIAYPVIPILMAGAITTTHVDVPWVWATTAVLIAIGWSLQIVRYSFFKKQRPALLDNPLHMLISPMFIMAKLFVAPGFRRDLAAILSGLATDKAPCTERGRRW